MAWYMEKYDSDGALISSEEDVTFEAVMEATNACRLGEFGHVRFIGPADATLQQLQALEELGARRTG